MLTEERIREYEERGYPVSKLVKSRRNKAKNWQVKLAMSEIDPKTYKDKLIKLPNDVWNRANEFKDAVETEKYINQANASVLAVKYKQKYENYRTYLIVSIMLGFYSTFFAISAYWHYFLGK